MTIFRIIPIERNLSSLQFQENGYWVTLFTSSNVECEREKERMERTWGRVTEYVYYKALSLTEARKFANEQGYSVLYGEEIRENRYRLQVVKEEK